MVKLVELDDSLFDSAFDLITRVFGDSTIKKAAWQRLFSSYWDEGPGHCGYAVLDGDRTIGFLSILFSQQNLAGKHLTIGNLSSLVIDPNYSKYGVRMLREANRLPYSYTVYTPIRPVYAFLKRIGFVDIDQQLVLVFKTPGFRRAKANGAVDVSVNVAEFSSDLNELEQRILEDHGGLDLSFLFLKEGRDTCFVLTQAMESSGVRFAFPLHVSNPALLQRHSALALPKLLGSTSTQFMAIDQRLLGGHPLPMSFTFPVATRRLCRPQDPEALQADNLYSEFPLLGVSGAPSVRGALKHQIDRLLKRHDPRKT